MMKLSKNLKKKDGPILGELLQYLSKRLAYKRLNNFDEAIYKAKNNGLNKMRQM